MIPGVLLLTAVPSCANGTEALGPDNVEIAALSISPASGMITAIGGTLQLSAVAHTAGGTAVAANQVRWESLDPDIARVDGSGLVTAVADGHGRIVASYSTVADTAGVWVSTASGPQLTPEKLLPLLGPLVQRGTGAVNNALAKYDSRYQQAELPRFEEFLKYENDPQGAFLLGNEYGGLRQRLSWAIRTGEPYGQGVTDESRYGYARGVRIIKRYLEYSKANGYGAQAHNNTGLADVEALYVLEGNQDALMHLKCTAASVANEDQYGYIKLTNNNTGPRIPAVALQALNAAIRLDLPYVTCPANGNLAVEKGYTWKSIGDRIISWLDQYGGVRPDGSVVATANKSETYFMDAMLATQLLRWYAWAGPNPRAYEMAKLIMDFVVREYQTKYQPKGWSTLPYLASSTGPAPDLAAFYIWPSLVLWQETGDIKYYQFAVQNLEATGTAYINGMKQFNQVYSTLGQDFESLASGVRWH